MDKLSITFLIINAIVGCIAGIILVILTKNYLYYLVNVVTAFTSGYCLSDKGQDTNQKESEVKR